MASIASTDGRRDHLIGRLTVRNRVVTVLRVVVPLVGLAFFVALVGQIWLANLARQYGVAGISIDRGHLVVQSPQYTVTVANGARYVVNAREARAALDNPDEIELTDATLDFAPPGRAAILATATLARLDSARQVVDVPGAMAVEGEDGLVGTLHGVHSDLATQLTSADGDVDITLADGTTIDAANMVFDANVQTWTFGDATVVFPGLPEAED